MKLISEDVQDIEVEKIGDELLLIQGGDRIVLSREQLAQLVAAQHRVQADLLPCGHSSDNLGNFGGCNPMGSCVICDAATSR